MTRQGRWNGRPDGPSDGEILASVLAGDTERFALLVQRHQDVLFGHARAMGLDRDTAADLVQETFVRAFQRLAHCRDPERFGVWVGRILRNRCLDHLKSAAVRKRSSLSPSLPTREGDPDREMEERNLRSALQTAIDELPPEQREAFVLRHVDGLDYGTMAELAETSISAMKMRVHRARERLRARMESIGAAWGVTSPG